MRGAATTAGVLAFSAMSTPRPIRHLDDVPWFAGATALDRDRATLTVQIRGSDSYGGSGSDCNADPMLSKQLTDRLLLWDHGEMAQLQHTRASLTVKVVTTYSTTQT
jgi:hypothetical protein